MDQLPPRLFVDVSFHGIQIVLLSRVFRVIVSQRSHQNHRYQTGQKDNHHERIEDGKPVDLVFEKVVIQIAFESLRELRRRRLPVDGIGDIELFSRF